MATNKTVTVSARGPENWLITTTTGVHTALVDQPEAMGGNNEGPSPLDYLFVSLAGCIITIGKIVAGQRQINLRGMEVEITGDLNLDVLRGKEFNERAGFKSIQASVKVDADISDEEKKAFLEEVDRRCPISDNLMYTTPLEIKLA